MATDFELLDAWRAGDREAGNELFNRYFPLIFSFFRNKAGTKAEDLAQQTFLSCVQAKDRFRKESSFRSYLFAIARNKLYSYFEQLRGPDRFDGGVSSCEDLGLSPTQQIARSEEQGLLLAALRRLPVDFQVALELYYFERLRGHELAAVLGIPEGTVRSRLRRGRDALRETLTELTASSAQLESTLTSLDDWADDMRKTAMAEPAAD